MEFIKKNKYLLSQVGLLFSLVTIDQLSKYMALLFLTSHSTSRVLGFSLQVPVQNPNLMLGWNFSSNQLILNSFLTTTFCVFLFCYILSLVFIPKNFHYLQSGISILFAGFTSNFINKISNGFVLDFIKWSPSQTLDIYFNLADIFQTIAWILILIQLVFLRKFLWKAKKEKRKQLLIIKALQLQFIGFCALAFFCLSFSFLLTNYQFVIFIEDMELYKIKHISKEFFKYSFSTLFLFCLIMVGFFTYLSNKIYGPLYAFEKYIKALLKGENPKDLTLRKNDQFKHLEDMAKEIKEEFNKFKSNQNS